MEIPPKKIGRKINNILMGAVIGCAIGSVVGMAVQKKREGIIKRLLKRRKKENE